MHENPNPSAFRLGRNGAIDLSRVLLIFIERVIEKVTAKVLFEGASMSVDKPGFVEFLLVDEAMGQDLLNAFETYHSKR